MNFFPHLLFLLLSVAAYALALPPEGLWVFCFGCLAPFFYALERPERISKAAFYGLFWGLILSVAQGYWVLSTLIGHYELPPVTSLVFFFFCLILPVSVIYLLFAILYRLFRGNSLVFYGLILPSLWVLLEYLKGRVPFFIPWGGLDIALAGWPRFVQIADTCGACGLVWMAAAVNGLMVFCLNNSFRISGAAARKEVRRVGMGAFLIGVLISAPLVYGESRLKEVRAEVQTRLADPETRVRATLVQGNFSTKERWSGMGFYQRVARYLEMSKDQGEKKEGPGARRVIIWPENTLNVSSKLNDALFIGLMREIGETALLIAGGLYADEKTGEVFNSAYFISGTGRLTRYDKHILLPYAETSPFLDPLDAYYTAPSRFYAGNTPLSMDVQPGPAGPSICFEILYPGLARGSVKQGSRYLVNLSNDSWFGESPMPWMHLAAARLRAIENRRFLLRASTSGISAIIGPDGSILARTRLFQQERVDGEFALLDRVSRYTRWGDWIILAAVGVLGIAAVQRVMGEGKGRHNH